MPELHTLSPLVCAQLHASSTRLDLFVYQHTAALFHLCHLCSISSYKHFGRLLCLHLALLYHLHMIIPETLNDTNFH